MKGAYIFNETINFSQIGSTGDFISKIPFMSKNTRFDSLDIDVSSGVIRYNNVDVYTSQGWAHQKYRTITLFEEQDDNEWSPNRIVVEQWIRENSVKVQTKKRATLTKTSNTGAPETTELYAKAYVTDIINEDGSQWIPSLAGSGGMGGGGSGAVSISTITNPEVVTSLGVKTELEFEWSSEADGNGTLYIYVDGDLKKTALAKQGIVKVDITNYISMATDYLVRLVVEDSFGSKRALNYQVSVINLIVNSTFDQTQAYTGSFLYRYTPFGSVSKTMHFVLDGVEKTQVVEESGREQTLEIKDLTHGVHTLKVYATATFGDTTIPSNELNYKFAYYQEGNSESIIVIFNNENETYEEGQTVKINYLVYTATSETSDITLYLNGQGQNLTVDRQPKVWSINDYNVGINTLAIAVQGLDVSSPINKTLTFNITAATITIKPFETGLQLYLASDTKSNNVSSRNEWTYGNITTTFNNFNFVSDGWLPDNNNIIGLKMTGDANIEINYQPFADDPKANGKTIELEFATSNVTNFDATVINIMANNRGILVKANEIFLKSTGTEVSTRFKENEHIRIAMVIESSTSNKFISTYINGVLSGIDVYGATDDFQQTTPVNIKAGSTQCDLTLYKIRVYNTQLTASNILDNYIADNSNYDEKTKIYRRNQIYDSYGNVLYNKVKNIMPVVTITAPILPSAKDQVEKLTSIKLENINNPTLNWEYNNLEFEIQGTSSVQYPVKNLEFKFGEDVIQLYPDAIPENRLTLKVDYASSAGVFNMGNAKIVNGIYQEKNPRQVEDARVRNALYGYPVAVFYRKTASDNLQFYCKGSLNLSKKANALGYKEGDESWEVKNNTSPLCLFKSDDFSTLAEDFEARYNKSGSSANLETLISWIKSCEGKPSQFRDECEDHFNLHYLLMYYVYGQIMGGADSYAKNLYLGFFAEGQNEDGTYYGKWYPEFYDLDTSYGINNTGELKFDYGTELHDKVGENYAFNGHDSLLWNLVEQAYADELKTIYQTLRNGEIVTYDSIMEVLQVQGIEQYPEAIYNEDAKIKYIEPYLAGTDYLDTALGSTLEHLKYWVANRLKYLDSKWIASSYSLDRISARITTPEGATKDYSITLKSRDDMYMQIQQGSYYATVRAKRNQEYTLEPELQENTEFNDTETYIYGASSLTYISDLSKWYLSLLKLGAATSLTELKVGDSSANYENPNLTTLEFGANKLLRKIDITNCTGLTGNIDLSQCINLQELYASGTRLTSVTFANGGQLKQAVLPNTIDSLSLINLKSIQSITTNGEFTTIRIENSNVDSLDYVQKSIAAGKLERLRLYGVDWTIESKDMLDYLIENVKGINSIGNNQDKSVISGKIHINGTVYLDEIKTYNSYWGSSLVVTAKNVINRYTCKYYNYDNTLLYETKVTQGNNSVYNGATPTKPMDIPNMKGYVFVGWDKSETNIQEDTNFYAEFEQRTLVKATFVDYLGNTLYEEFVPSGGIANYVGETPTKPRDYQNQLKFEFAAWNPNSTFPIYSNTTFTPAFSSIPFYKVTWVNWDGSVIKTEYADNGEYVEYTGTIPTRPNDSQYAYTFSGWSPNPENTVITKDTTFTAGYSLTTLCKVTWVNWDGSVLYEVGVYSGEKAVYNGPLPTKPDTEQYKDFAFTGWDKNTDYVTENMVVTAQFVGTLKTYFVYWYVFDQLVETDPNVAYGTVGVSFDGVEPSVSGFIFKGWSTEPNAEEPMDVSTIEVKQDITLYAVMLDKYAAATAEIEYIYTRANTSTSNYISLVQFYDTSGEVPTNPLQVDLDDGNGWQNIQDSGTAVVNFTDWEGLAGKSYRKFRVDLPARAVGSYKVKIKYLEGLEFMNWVSNQYHALYYASYGLITKLKYSPLMQCLIGSTYQYGGTYSLSMSTNEIELPENVRFLTINGIPVPSNKTVLIPTSLERIEGSWFGGEIYNYITINFNMSFEEYLNLYNTKLKPKQSISAYLGKVNIFTDKTIVKEEYNSNIDVDLLNIDISSIISANSYYDLINGLKGINKLTMPASIGRYNLIYCCINKINTDEEYVWDFTNIFEIKRDLLPKEGKYNFSANNNNYINGVKKLLLPKTANVTFGSVSSGPASSYALFSVPIENIYYNGDINDYVSLNWCICPAGNPDCNFYFNNVLQTSETECKITASRCGYGAFGYLPYKKIEFSDNTTYISTNAFEGMKNLEEIVNCPTLPKGAFTKLNKDTGPVFTNYKGTGTSSPGNLYGGAITTRLTYPDVIKATGSNDLYPPVPENGTTFYIPEGIEIISNQSIRPYYSGNINITVVLPSTTKQIGSKAIYMASSSAGVSSLVIKATTPPTFASDFLSSPLKEYIVPTESVDAYKATTNITQYADQIIGGAENYD